MKRPENPPDPIEVFAELQAKGRVEAVFGEMSRPSLPAKYLHWDKLRHHKAPRDLNHREWWLAIKAHRRGQYKAVPFKDLRGGSFNYYLADPAPERLHEMDLRLGGSIGIPQPVMNPDTKNQYLVSSLIEEAITSSQLEGAATTRKVAKQMIRAGRPPRDRSERMILNNFRTMQRIAKLKDKRLSMDLVLDLHRLVTSGTLDDRSDEGRLRRGEVVVDDYYGRVFHKPPPADELDERMAAMCEFANDKSLRGFIHPVVRSIILHFWLAYDHPFVDGNGRTARALFYWSMLSRGYWLCEFISISEIVLKAPAKYGRAFLYTETDDNDLTYFLLYHLEVLRRAVDQLHKYVKRKQAQLQAAEIELRGITLLNHRQRALLGHALLHPHHPYTTESHRASHNVVHQTARADLLDLVDRGLITKEKVWREWHFTPAPDLERRLREL